MKWTLVVSVLGLGQASEVLPSRPLASLAVKGAHNQTSWWARVGDQVFYPPSTKLGLSQDISHYFYAAGYDGALTEEMRSQRVGGGGLWHIFHLPGGPSTMKMPRDGSRRSSMSALVGLKQGIVLSDDFPAYVAKPGYAHPGGAGAELKEKQAANTITPGLVEGYLKKIVDLGDGKYKTRSHNNEEASYNSVMYIQDQFKSMGLTTCLHEFEGANRPYVNVVAYIPGKGKGTVTVGAHFDSRPFQGTAPGAEDNGSGVAAMLAAAKAYSQAKFRSSRSVLFVAFAAEEIGMVGSNAFAAALKGEASAAKLPKNCRPAAGGSPSSFLRASVPEEHAAIIMDEVGWKSPKLKANTINFEAYEWADPVMRHLFEANKLHNAQNMSVIHSNKPFGSDHMAFLNRKVPGVLLINAHDTDYVDYHKSTDTIDHVNMEYVAQVGKFVLGGLVRIAGTQP